MSVSLSANDLSYVREWVGTDDPDDATIFEVALRTDINSPIEIARAILRQRLADYLASPSSYSIVGVYQESSDSNITALRGLLSDIDAIAPSDPNAPANGQLSVLRIVRAGYSR